MQTATTFLLATLRPTSLFTHIGRATSTKYIALKKWPAGVWWWTDGVRQSAKSCQMGVCVTRRHPTWPRPTARAIGLKKYLGKPPCPSPVTWPMNNAKFVNRIEDVCGLWNTTNSFGSPKTLLNDDYDLFAKIGLLCYCDKQQKIVSLSTWLIAFLQDRGHQHDSTIRSQRSFINTKVSPLYILWRGIPP